MTIVRLRNALLLLLSTLLFGILGYHFVEGMTFFEAFYMTIITISTVGFSEIKHLSIYGRIITLIIIITGITIGTYSIGTLLRMLVEGEIRKTFGRRKMEKDISKLKDHYIICGYGRIGRLICKELRLYKKDLVVIENDPNALQELEEERILFIPADATQDESLEKAGIMKAKAIVTAVKSDSDNVFITLTAKGLRPEIFVLSRASDEKNEIKLKRAGAARVVSPYFIGGKRMAQVLLRPAVVDFIDVMVMDSRLGLSMEEVVVSCGSSYAGKNLIESNLRKHYGVIIVLIKKANGDMLFNPVPTEILEENDVIVVIGKSDEMARLKEDM